MMTGGGGRADRGGSYGGDIMACFNAIKASYNILLNNILFSFLCTLIGVQKEKIKSV